MSSLETMRQLDRVRIAFKEAEEALASGPASFYFEKVNMYVETLFNRFAPFRVGDLVRLTETPEISEKVSWGWLGAKHFLIKGAIARVVQVDMNKGLFTAGLHFADESWKDYNGNLHAKDQPSCYWFSERSIERVNV